jgi:hypothetical protein
MMRDTPRSFIGSVGFLLQVPVCRHLGEAVLTEVGRMPGIRGCDLDVAAGALVVTADTPVDRTDVLAALHRVGCRVRP